MKIFLAADHRGFSLKEHAKAYLAKQSYEIVDCGATSYMPEDDYVDYGSKALDKTTWLPDDRAILFCGSGHGMDILANRHSHIRAILGFNPSVVKQGRAHEDANVLIVPADWTTSDQAIELSNLFLNTPFSEEERHIRRLEKLNKIDELE